MPDLLNGTARGTGTGTSTLVTMQAGRFSKTLATNVPGDECDPGTSFDGIWCNSVAFLAGKYHSVLTDVYATAPPNGTLTPTWTTQDTTRQAGNNPERSGLHYCLTSAGPGVVHGFRNPADGTTRILRYDADTDTITTFNQTAGSEFTANNPIYSSYVVGGNTLFMFGSNTLCQVWDLETGALTIISAPGTGNHTRMISEVGGNIYTFTRGSTGVATFFIWLGGNWVVAKEDPAATVMGTLTTGAGVPCWQKGGKLYGCIKPNLFAENGWFAFEWDPSTNVWTDVTATLLPDLLKKDGGLTDIAAANVWDAGFYVDVDTAGAPRYMLQVFPNLSDQNPGCVLFEHTGSALVLVGDTDINGGSNCKTLAQSNVAPYSYIDVSGKLWGSKWAEPQSNTLGMLLTFRFGGDPGNADKKIRIYHSAPNGPPETRSNTLVAPVGGLGQVGASLVDEGGGVYRVDNWDADGATDLTVIHRTLVDSIPNGVETEWSAKIRTT